MFSLLMRHPSPLLPPPPQFSHLLTQQNQNSQFNQKLSPSNPSKPFRCNVCRQAYGQPATFDTHLRSLSHINQMNRLQQLVESGQVGTFIVIFVNNSELPCFNLSYRTFKI